MRRFIYYDSASINSFLAQMENGLSILSSQEKSKEDSSNIGKENGTSLIGDISAKVFSFGAELKSDLL